MLDSRNPGRMDRRIDLWYPIITRTVTGGVIESFAALSSIPCSVVNSSRSRGAEFQAAEALQVEGYTVFTTRYRSDITSHWRVYYVGRLFALVANPIEMDRRRYQELYTELMPDQGSSAKYPGGQSFTVDLAQGDTTKDIVFPVMFSGVPTGVAVQLLIPDGGFTFPADPVFPSITASGLTVALGAAVPDVGYKLSIQAAL